ncbi:MAG: NADH-quinone oxidoreductase subunit NuoG [Anaerolineales bacterium]|nr:MAG: NADH-quinone oxidoreductase subunit NuoG [Anaerolineales bacterium]
MEPLVTLTIDDHEATVPEGTTVLEAAKSIGVEIPTLCHYEKLAPFGGCRICLVEIEKMRGLQTACTTVVRPEMVVRTASPEVLKTRKAILEFLLTNHPLDCPVCDKGGECDLQDFVFKWGPTESRYIEEKRHKRKAYTLSPLIVKDEERCVLCRRCVRYLEEWADDLQLDYFERGRLTRVDTFPGQAFDSVFSGNTIDICPVGALTSRVFRFRARSWELEEVPGICSYCGVGCNVTLDVKTNKLRRISGRENPAVNDGWLCDKGRFAHQYMDSPERVTQPLVRKNGELKPASWDEALSLASQRLREIVQESGPHSVGGVGSATVTNEAAYLFQKFMRTVLGTNNVDHLGRLPDGVHPLPSITKVREADTILLLGADTLEEAPVIELFIRKSANLKGAKVVVAHPRRINLTGYDGPWLAYRPGTEVALLNGLAHVILAEGLHKEGRRVTELEEWVKDYPPDKVEEITAVPAETLREAARVLTEAQKAILIYGLVTVRGPHGQACLAALNNLALLIGAYEPGCLAQEPNSWGVLDVGLAPHLYPGRQRLEDDQVRKRLGKRWKAELPSEAGLGLDEMLKATLDGELEALYIMAANPVMDHPIGDEALEKAKFLIVQDLFLTETARLADVVLPAASFAEADGTFTNMAGRVQRLHKALRLPAEVKPHGQIIVDLARVMGKKLGPYSPPAVMEEITRVAASYEGLSYGSLGDDGIQAAIATEGRTRRFAQADFQAPAADAAYPLALVTGRLLYDQGFPFAQSETMRQFVPEPFVELNPADAEALGIADQDAVTVSSARDSLELKAKVSDDIRPGCVFVPLHLNEMPVVALSDVKAAVTWVKVTKRK